MRVKSAVLMTFLLVLALLPLLPASAADSSPPPLIHPPMLRSSSQSLNWAGFAVTGSTGSVTDARGSWVVPSVAGTCSTTDQYSSFWVGIDGFSSSTVEQLGTDSDCYAGAPSYYAWYEFYPQPSYLISGLSINPGNKVGAEVKYSGGIFTLIMKDFTTGQLFTTTGSVPSAQRSSAEWIAEAPSNIFGVLPLSNFGTADYGLDYTQIPTTCYANVGGSFGNVGSFGASVQQINMVNSQGSLIAQTSALSTDGSSFMVQTVTGPTPYLSVSVSTSNPSYSQGSTAVLTVQVLSSSTGLGISGASVSLKITAPTGQSGTLAGTTNSAGDATFSVPIPSTAPTGTYIATATATSPGYSGGSSSTTFQIT